MLTEFHLSMKEIPFARSIKLCDKMLTRNLELITKVSGVNGITKIKNKKLVLCPRIISFSMVALCDDEYRILKHSAIYIKIWINYKSGDKVFYFYQNTILDHLHEGCPNNHAIEILR